MRVKTCELASRVRHERREKKTRIACVGVGVDGEWLSLGQLENRITNAMAEADMATPIRTVIVITRRFHAARIAKYHEPSATSPEPSSTTLGLMTNSLNVFTLS